jgi:Tfp pilus assembly protein FimT
MRLTLKKTARSGFTIVEIIIIVAILGTLAGIAGPQMSRIVRHSRTNRAAYVITADLQNAFAAAARQREPVSIVADSISRSYQFIDRKTGTVLKVRTFYGDTSEYRLSRLVFSPKTIDVFPSGVSSAPLTIDLANGDYPRRITASTAGFVRLVPR